MRLAAGAATDTGRVRTANEDSVLVTEGVFAVADGMGGHRGGEVASSAALEAFGEAVGPGGTPQSLLDGVDAANRAVFERSAADAELAGMGTTLVAIAGVATEAGERVAIVNVGDSRVYLLSGDEFVQLSEDHSLVETMVRTGQLSAEEASVHPRRNVLTRALGIEPSVDVDGWLVAPHLGDRFLLCSDGLFNELDDEEIISVLRRLTNPAEAAWELVRLSNESGGRDNISAVVVDVEGDAPTADSDGVDGAAVVEERVVRLTEPAEELVIRGESDVYIAAPMASVPAPDPDRPATPPPSTASSPGAGSTTTAPPTAAEPTGMAGPAEHHRRFTWRVWALLAAIVAVLVVAAVAVASTARSGYFLAEESGQIVLYQGQRGGLWFIDPTRVGATGIEVADLRESDSDLIATTKFRTRADVDEYVGQLRMYAEQGQETTTTTVAPTTTQPVDPAATTTVVAGP